MDLKDDGMGTSSHNADSSRRCSDAAGLAPMPSCSAPTAALCKGCPALSQKSAVWEIHPVGK